MFRAVHGIERVLRRALGRIRSRRQLVVSLTTEEPMKKRMMLIALVMAVCSATLLRCGKSSSGGSICGTVNVSKF